jgi:hypothetical protein
MKSIKIVKKGSNMKPAGICGGWVDAPFIIKK